MRQYLRSVSFSNSPSRDDTMSHIESENNGAVRRITINRPEKKNALTAEMYEDLSDALEKAESAPEVRVMLLHGAGEAFTAGNRSEERRVGKECRSRWS